MDTQKKVESPLMEGTVGGLEKMYYTADEAMSFMEPRIRAMFK